MAGQDTNKLVGVNKENVCILKKNKMKACLQVMGAGGAGAFLLLLIVLVAVTTRSTQ